jgi:hypothetical protein
MAIPKVIIKLKLPEMLQESAKKNHELRTLTARIGRIDEPMLE